MNQREHWDEIYGKTPADKVGWYTPHLDISLKWVEALDVPRTAQIIDVGSGASTLAGDLLREGYRHITLVDISGNALALAKTRLGDEAASLVWIEGDITTLDLPAGHYDLWHDRAVFHFLTSAQQQQQYRDNLLKALRPGGHAIIATFAREAPPKCSGLPVKRYTPDELQHTLGPQLEPGWQETVLHVTPGGVEQMYLYCQFRRLTHPA